MVEEVSDPIAAADAPEEAIRPGRSRTSSPLGLTVPGGSSPRRPRPRREDPSGREGAGVDSRRRRREVVTKHHPGSDGPLSGVDATGESLRGEGETPCEPWFWMPSAPSATTA